MKFDDMNWALNLNAVPDESAQQRASRVLNAIIKGMRAAERSKLEGATEAAKAGNILVRTVGQS